MSRAMIDRGYSESATSTDLPLREPLSPELALVDPELAERARRALVPPGTTDTASVRALWESQRAAQTALEEETRPRRLQALRTVAATGLVVGLSVVGLLVGLEVANEQPVPKGEVVRLTLTASGSAAAEESPTPRRRSPALSVPVPPTPASAIPPRARNRAQAPASRRERPTSARTQPIAIRWEPVNRATFYWVQVYRVGLPGARKVLEAAPTRPRLIVRSRGRFRPGRYRWEVWPQFSSRQTREYGRLKRTGVFVVRPS